MPYTSTPHNPPLIMRGNLRIGIAGFNVQDVSDAVTKFIVKSTVDTIKIPATLSTPKQNRGGGADYSIEIEYLSTDQDSNSLFRLLWEAIGTQSKELWFEGSNADGPITANNPMWGGTFIVTDAAVGGPAEGLSTATATFPLKTAPTMYLSAVSASDSV